MTETFIYVTVRSDTMGPEVRAKFMYVGDAFTFIKSRLPIEVNQCLWTVHKTDVPSTRHSYGQLIARWRYEAGRITQEV